MPASNDVIAPTALALAGYERAREPKRLHILPGGHFSAYEEGFDESSRAAVDWYRTHLVAGRP